METLGPINLAGWPHHRYSTVHCNTHAIQSNTLAPSHSQGLAPSSSSIILTVSSLRSLSSLWLDSWIHPPRARDEDTTHTAVWGWGICDSYYRNNYKTLLVRYKVSSFENTRLKLEDHLTETKPLELNTPKLNKLNWLSLPTLRELNWPQIYGNEITYLIVTHLPLCLWIMCSHAVGRVAMTLGATYTTCIPL